MSADLTLPPEAASVGAAREFVARTLAAWRLPELVDSAVLAVSELATNALLHARSQFTVSVEVPNDEIVLAVADRSTLPLHLRRYNLAATTGRGLRLVAALTTAWGVDQLAHGKRVWCALPTTPAQLPDPTAAAYAEFDVDAW